MHSFGFTFSAYACVMPEEKVYPEQQGRMSYQPAKLNKIQGFSIAHLEQRGETGQQRVVGTFKGERTFFQAHSHTSRKMTYEGFVEHEGLIFYAVVPVQVDVQVRQAKFRAVGAPAFWQRITDL